MVGTTKKNTGGMTRVGHDFLRTGVLLGALLIGQPSGAVELSLRADGRGEDTREALVATTLLSELSRDNITEGQRVLAAAQADYARLLGALYDRGYFSSQISIRLDGREADEISPIAAPASVGRADVVIDLGPKFLFGRASVAPLAPGTSLPENFAPGKTARVTELRAATSAAIAAWRDAGHARADVASQSITARHAAERLDAEVRLDPGPSLTFGPLRIVGDTRVNPERIRAIAGLRQGKPFLPSDLEDAEARLQRTGTFRAAALSETDDTVNGDQMVIEAQLADMKPRRFGFGAELFSRRGLTLSTFWLHRNLLGGAERLRFDAEIGGIGGQDDGIDGLISVRFDRPSTFNARTDFYALALLERADEPKYRTDRVLLEAGASYRRDRRRTFTAGLALEAARTRDDLGTREYTLVSLPLSAEYEGRDDPLDPLSGWYGKADVTPFAGIDGIGSGARVLLDLRGYRSLNDRTVLALRGQLGSIVDPEITDTPSSYLFYSGGSSTVRGHAYQSLGVTLPGGAETGGRSLLTVAAELRRSLKGNFGVVAFAEAGYVGAESFPNGSDGTWHSGAGLGVRYDTGIGPIRFDLAVPVTGDGDGFQMYIGIGQAF